MAKRKKYTSDQKVKILRAHLLEKALVSDLCDKYGISPALFYRWQKEFFEKGSAAFEKAKDAPSKKLVRENEALKSKIAQRDEVIAEIMESHVALKKSLGEL